MIFLKKPRQKIFKIEKNLLKKKKVCDIIEYIVLCDGSLNDRVG